MLEIAFATVILIAEAELAHHLFAVAVNFVEILDFHGEFYETEFHNSIQD